MTSKFPLDQLHSSSRVISSSWNDIENNIQKKIGILFFTAPCKRPSPDVWREVYSRGHIRLYVTSRISGSRATGVQCAGFCFFRNLRLFKEVEIRWKFLSKLYVMEFVRYFKPKHSSARLPHFSFFTTYDLYLLNNFELALFTTISMKAIGNKAIYLSIFRSSETQEDFVINLPVGIWGFQFSFIAGSCMW